MTTLDCLISQLEKIRETIPHSGNWPVYVTAGLCEDEPEIEDMEIQRIDTSRLGEWIGINAWLDGG